MTTQPTRPPRKRAPANVPEGQKWCHACDSVKPVEEFNRNRTRKDGRQARCRDCDKAWHAAWRSANEEYHQERVLRWRTENPDKNAAQSRRWAAKNPDYYRRWRAKNPDKNAAKDHRYRSSKSSALLPWLPLGWDAQTHALARHLGLHVDHIIPLAGCRQCGQHGLHIPHNLQLLTATENSRKGATCSACHQGVADQPSSNVPALMALHAHLLDASEVETVEVEAEGELDTVDLETPQVPSGAAIEPAAAAAAA